MHAQTTCTRGEGPGDEVKQDHPSLTGPPRNYFRVMGCSSTHKSCKIDIPKDLDTNTLFGTVLVLHTPNINYLTFN